ncbi:u1 zinc finger domain-containing protein [Phthorimaea operculella]|nr:u1 zinc finger domain-containing protein [Phthorimaea operculella]
MSEENLDNLNEIMRATQQFLRDKKQEGWRAFCASLSPTTCPTEVWRKIKRFRTEYWKSQARKYCEFCKCWFADNKVSISFHENGKKHKEAVQKHISTLTKKSTKDARQKDKMDDEMKKMEEAAMAAYLKDVQNNADLTSQSINEMLGQQTSSSGNSGENPAITTASAKSKAPPAWQEVKSEDGSSYFWNTETNETTWDPPDEYVSVAQQEEEKLKEAEQKKIKEKHKANEKKQKQKEAIKEAKAYAAREQMRELAVKEPKPVSNSNIVPPPSEYGPAPRAPKPYGSWTPVVNEPVEQVDLQLPKSSKEVLPPPVVMEPEVIKFGEKRVASLGEGPVEFKRRKLGHAKRNMRQKQDDE